MSRKRTRSGPGAHQERAGAYRGGPGAFQEWARSGPGVSQERTRSGPDSRDLGRARAPAPSHVFREAPKLILFFELYLKSDPFVFLGLRDLFGVQAVGAGAGHEPTRDGQKPNGVGQEQPE